MFDIFRKKGLIYGLAAFFAAFTLCFGSVGSVLAVEDDEIESVSEEKSEKEEKKTKKSDASDEDDEDKEDKESDDEKFDKTEKGRKKGEKPVLAEGETGILIDSVSGRVLYESDADKKMYPASTTKVMTALLAVEAIERGEKSLEDKITITEEMLKDSDPDGSNIALRPGEIMTLDNLLKGLMVASGNDAACAIATYIGGDIPSFVAMMNERAAQIGAANTNFINPHGLHNENHYTTAADMAKIAHTAMKYDKFRNIVDIVHIKIPPTNVTEKERYYINTNGLLSTMRYTDYFYKGSIGIKTGYTSDAGNCLVSAANRDGLEFIAVLFGGKDAGASHKESIEMLEWGYEAYTTAIAVTKDDMLCEVKVKQGKGTDSLTLSAKNSVRVVLPKETKIEELEIRPNLPEAVYAPITAETEVGTVSVMLGGEEIGSGVLVAAKTVERSFFWPVMALGEWLWSMPLMRVLVGVIGAGLVFFILLFFVALRKNIKKAKRRRRKPLHKK